MPVSNNRNTQSTSSINSVIGGASSGHEQPLHLQTGSSHTPVITPMDTNNPASRTTASRTTASRTTAGATQITEPDRIDKHTKCLPEYLLDIPRKLLKKQIRQIETTTSELERKETELKLEQQQEALVTQSNSTTASAMSSQSVDHLTIQEFLSLNLSLFELKSANLTSLVPIIKAIGNISTALRLLVINDEEYKKAQEEYNKTQQTDSKKASQKGKVAQSTTVTKLFSNKNEILKRVASSISLQGAINTGQNNQNLNKLFAKFPKTNPSKKGKDHAAKTNEPTNTSNQQDKEKIQFFYCTEFWTLLKQYCSNKSPLDCAHQQFLTNKELIPNCFVFLKELQNSLAALTANPVPCFDTNDMTALGNLTTFCTEQLQIYKQELKTSKEELEKNLCVEKEMRNTLSGYQEEIKKLEANPSLNNNQVFEFLDKICSAANISLDDLSSQIAKKIHDFFFVVISANKNSLIGEVSKTNSAKLFKLSVDMKSKFFEFSKLYAYINELFDPNPLSVYYSKTDSQAVRTNASSEKMIFDCKHLFLIFFMSSYLETIISCCTDIKNLEKYISNYEGKEAHFNLGLENEALVKSYYLEASSNLESICNLFLNKFAYVETTTPDFSETSLCVANGLYSLLSTLLLTAAGTWSIYTLELLDKSTPQDQIQDQIQKYAYLEEIKKQAQKTLSNPRLKQLADDKAILSDALLTNFIKKYDHSAMNNKVATLFSSFREKLRTKANSSDTNLSKSDKTNAVMIIDNFFDDHR